MQRKALLKGDFAIVAFPELLQVTALGRQYIEIQLRDTADATVARVWVKGGMVVAAETPRATGRAAFFEALESTQARVFLAFQVTDPEAYAEPVGPLDSLLLQAAVAQDERRASAPRPRPVSPVSPPPLAVPAASVVPPPPAHPVLAVVSPKGGVGKTTVTLNLALALAQQGHSVLLLDVDPQGGIGASLAPQARRAPGIYDAVMGRASLQDCLLATRVKTLRILPAGHLASEEALSHIPQLMSAELWAKYTGWLAGQADVVIVDTPAGIMGVTGAVLGAATHVLGVLQTDPLTLRSFPMLRRTLDDLERRGRGPRLAGIVLNRVPDGDAVPLSALREIGAAHSLELLLEPAIPEDAAFTKASAEGIPVSLHYAASGRDYARLFGELAGRVGGRLGLTPYGAGSKLSLVV